MTLKRLILMLSVLVFVIPAYGQENASLQGNVTDQNGAGIPNAAITLTNQSTGVVNKTTSNDRAEFQILYLPLGHFTLSCEAKGFRTYEQPVSLDVGQAGYITIKMQVGPTTNSVTVTAEEPLLEATTADHDQVIDHALVTEIPVTGHTAIMQIAITPGVAYGGGTSQRPFDNGGTGNWNINGGSSFHNEFFLDGAPDNFTNGNQNAAAYMPTPDVVQETKILTNIYDAQYGKTGGGIVTFTTKSGGNDIHGAAYTYLQRTGWTANTYANNYLGGAATGHPRPVNFINQWGGVVTGPVIIPKFYHGRNKTFFMFNYDGYNSNVPRTVTASVPMPEMLNGDFSNYRTSGGSLIPIYDWTTGNPTTGAGRTQFSYNGIANVIPPGRIDQTAKKILSYYSCPASKCNAANSASAGSPYSISDFYDVPTETNPYNSIVFRIDHNLSDSNRLFFRHLRSRYQNHSRNGSNGIYDLPGENVQYLYRNNEGDALNWNWAFKPKAVLDLTLSYNRYEEYNGYPADYNFNTTNGFGFSDATFPIQNFFGTFSFTQYTSLGGTVSDHFINTPAILPQVTFLFGAHTLKAGADLRYVTTSGYSPNTWGESATNALTNAVFSTVNNSTGNALASFLLGGASSSATYNPKPYYTYPYGAVYIQDEWRFNKRLTINLGLRDDVVGGATERYNRVDAGFNPSAVNPIAPYVSTTAGCSTCAYPALVPRLLGGLQFADVGGISRDVWPTTMWNFQPRLGVAYRISDKLVARGGWGRMYINPDWSVNLITNGWTQSTSATASQNSFNTLTCEPGVATGPCFPESPFPNGFIQPSGSTFGYGTSVGNAFSYVTSNWKPSYVDQYSFGFQYQMPLSSVLDVSYVGSSSNDLVSQLTPNNVPLAYRQSCDLYEGATPAQYAVCATNVANPMYYNATAGTGPPQMSGSSLNTSTISNYNLNVLYPEFSTLTEVGRHDDSMWFNSAQVVWRANLKNRLTTNINYTFSKQMMTGYSGNYSGSNQDFLDPIKGILNRSVYEADQTHRFSTAVVYHLPFGKDQMFFSNTNRIVSSLISGFQLSPWMTWYSGTPWAVPNAILVGDPHLSHINFKSNPVQVVNNCVAQYNYTTGVPALLATSVANGCTSYDWIVTPNYAPRTLPYLDPHVRLHTTPLLMASISKTTPITERLSIQLRAEAFNATNTQNSAGKSADATLTDSTFGEIVRNGAGAVNGSTNIPARAIQLTGKIIW